MATKEGYAGLDLPPITLGEGDPSRPQAVDPIRLSPGLTLSGIVVDHRGQPVSGARVESNQTIIHNGSRGIVQSVQTDDKGPFRLRDVHRGVTQVVAFHGKGFKSWMVFADGSPEDIRLELPERQPQPGANLAALRHRARPIAVGQAAPDWQVGTWSDGPRPQARRGAGQGRRALFLGDVLLAERGRLAGHGKARSRVQAARGCVPGDSQRGARRGPFPGPGEKGPGLQGRHRW